MRGEHIYISTTSNIAKFKKLYAGKVEEKKEEMNARLKTMALEAFDIVLSNTPADTGQLMYNWRFYLTRGQNLYMPIVGYERLRHDKYDMAGRIETQHFMHELKLREFANDMEIADVDFFKEGRKRYTIGIKNSAPYMPVVDNGEFPTNIKEFVNTTPSGYSVQAPNGILDVSYATAKLGGQYTPTFTVRRRK